MDERDKKYYRRITHHKYERKIPYEKEDGSNWVRKCIYNNSYYPLDEINIKGGSYTYADDKYLVNDCTSNIKSVFRFILYFAIPLFIGGFFLEVPMFEQSLGIVLFYCILFFINIFLLYFSFFYPPFIYI